MITKILNPLQLDDNKDIEPIGALTIVLLEGLETPRWHWILSSNCTLKFVSFGVETLT